MISPSSTVRQADEDSEASLHDLLEYKWSRIIRPSSIKDGELQIFDCTIDKSELAQRAKNQSESDKEWRFLFCAEQFDDQVELAQFQPAPLGFEEMQRYGIMASVIRQDILTLAKEMEEGEDPDSRDPLYHQSLIKRLYRNIEGTEMETRVKMNPEIF